MAVTYTVKKGDTLWDIAQTYNEKYGTTVSSLVKLNNISDPDYIVVGQKIKISSTSSSTTTKNTTKQVTITEFGILASATDKTLVVKWRFDRANTKEYKIQWQYKLQGDGTWYSYQDDGYTTTNKYHTLNVEKSNVTVINVRCRVKPVSDTYQNSKGKTVSYWTGATWTTWKYFSMSSFPPKTPANPPEVTISGTKLTAKLEHNNSLEASIIWFDIAQDGKASYKTKGIKIDKSYSYVTYEVDVKVGSSYKVKCRTKRDGMYSDWTGWSESVLTAPPTPTNLTCSMSGDNSPFTLKITWDASAITKGYEIQYTTDKAKFDDTNEEGITKATVESDATNQQLTYTKDDITEEGDYYVRIRSYNGDSTKNYSEWTSISSTTAASDVEAPLVATESKSYVVGKDVLALRWTHQAESESNYATYSEIEIYVDGEKKVGKTIAYVNSDKEALDEDEYKNNQKEYIYDISEFTSDAIINWRARTAGSSLQFGPWSAMDQIVAYIPPVIEMTVTDGNNNSLSSSSTNNDQIATWADNYEPTDSNIPASNWITEPLKKQHLGDLFYVVGNIDEDKLGQVYRWSVVDGVYKWVIVEDFSGSNGNSLTVTSLPLKLEINVDPNSDQQVPNGYYMTITANQEYESVDTYGDTTTIREGDVVFSKYLDDLSSLSDLTKIEETLSAGDFNLDNGITYTLSFILSMANSGLSSELSLAFTTDWEDSEYSIDAEIYIDDSDWTAAITPYCEDADGVRMNNVKMAVYRREYDGRYTKIASDIASGNNITVVDPHPALDYARYRIVGTTNDSSTTMYNDIPGYPVGCKSIIIQWDERWSNFDETDGDLSNDESWSGSMLKLDYNIDVSEKVSPDVSLIEYVGRENPVSYYGTHNSETATWNTTIRKDDKDTLYALRRLAKWKGDVYVREPSGIGYWAHVTTSFNLKHLDLTIPVSIEVTRVEGGV